jgi:hypothetical protein
VAAAYLASGTGRGSPVTQGAAEPPATSAALDESTSWSSVPADSSPLANGSGDPSGEARSAGAEPIDAEAHPADALPAGGRRWGDGSVCITCVRLSGPDGRERSVLRAGEPLVVTLMYQVRRAIEELVIGFAVVRDDDVCCYGTNTAIEGLPVPVSGDSGQVQVVLERLDLVQGQYYLDVAVHPVEGPHYDYHHKLHPFVVHSARRDVGIVRIPHRWSFEAAPSGDRADPLPDHERRATPDAAREITDRRPAR